MTTRSNGHSHISDVSDVGNVGDDVDDGDDGEKLFWLLWAILDHFSLLCTILTILGNFVAIFAMMS